MSSRRDQVDAQRYMLTRVTGALVRAEPETAESPTRRDRTGTVGGLVFAVLLVGIAAVWALFPGAGSTRWQQPRMLVVDAGTGARYLLMAGRLRPVNDVATATLAAGGKLTPVVVASRKLARLPHGEPLGNPAGPQVLPAASRLKKGVWRACDLGKENIGLDIGVPADPGPLGADEAMTVSADGKTYLLWGGRRLRIGAAWVTDVLGLAPLTPVPVGTTWLNLIPLSGSAEPPVVDGEGGKGPAVAGQPTTVGQMFDVDLDTGTVGHYMMTVAGLAPMTDTEYLLKRARPGARAVTVIGPADLAAALQRGPATPLSTLPATPPKRRPVPDGTAVCVEYTGHPGGPPAVVFSPDFARPAGAGAGGAAVVRVPPGGGALLLPRLDGDLSQLTAGLVDERGFVYLVASRDLSALGYGTGQAVVMPPSLVAMLPKGPALVRPERG
jgi:type VII secretion protein EccB